MNWCIEVGARRSQLSQKQVWEVLDEIRTFFPSLMFAPNWLATSGDIDQKRSLRDMENSDFFCKEIHQQQLENRFRIAIHSAKDLSWPLPEGLFMAALTKGQDPSDVLVMPTGKTVATLGPQPRIGTSSLRREETIRSLIPDALFVDIRGTIEKRLELLASGNVDGLVMAEAALIRLGLTHHNRLLLPGPVARYQGQLAIIVRDNDEEMKKIFAYIDSRES